MSSSEPKNSLSNADEAFDSLVELERQTSDEIRRQRAHDRLTIKAKVIIKPGNSSDRLKFRIEGITGDVSAGGCRVMMPVPIGVGDVFRLDFEDPRLDLPMVFARCMRCSFVREDAFEVGFKFFSQVSLQTSAAETVSDDKMLI